MWAPRPLDGPSLRSPLYSSVTSKQISWSTHRRFKGTVSACSFVWCARPRPTHAPGGPTRRGPAARVRSLEDTRLALVTRDHAPAMSRRLCSASTTFRRQAGLEDGILAGSCPPSVLPTTSLGRSAHTSTAAPHDGTTAAHTRALVAQWVLCRVRYYTFLYLTTLLGWLGGGHAKSMGQTNRAESASRALDSAMGESACDVTRSFGHIRSRSR